MRGLILTSHPDDTRRLELRALKKMTVALCEHTEQLAAAACARGAVEAREARLQLQVFSERRNEAADLLARVSNEPDAIRIARFEKLVEALECSRVYFKRLADEADFVPRRVAEVE